jgi:tRNA(Ile)-lysidine synthase
LDGAAFAALMAPFAPFEPRPHLAVGVSGGADSLALALLSDRWARERGGQITALTVDHRLRAESADEARQVAAWLAARGIAHRILAWDGPHPRRGLPAAARAARYRLLEAWCAGAGVLHLLVAHHRNDQAETLLLRLARGSGLFGLAGMPALAEHAGCRLLRPLLSVGRARLVATLQAAGQTWIEDPSNRDPRYARARLRQALAAFPEPGLDAQRLADTAARLARSRMAVEASVARLLACAAMVHPAGFVRLDAAAWRSATEETGLRALAAVIGMVGGAEYPPRSQQVAALYRAIGEGLHGGRTLGGCRILPRRGGLLICREPVALAADVAAPPGGTTSWDGRFRLRLPAAAPAGMRLGARGLVSAGRSEAKIPAAARPGLPVLRLGKGGPASALTQERERGREDAWLPPRTLIFRPVRPLSDAGFTVV